MSGSLNLKNLQNEILGKELFRLSYQIKVHHRKQLDIMIVEKKFEPNLFNDNIKEMILKIV